MSNINLASSNEISGIVMEARKFIKEQLKIVYLLGNDEKLFLDLRFEPEDVLLMMHHLCKLNGIDLRNMSRFEGDFTVNSISSYIANNIPNK
jgi:hypothetical protein